MAALTDTHPTWMDLARQQDPDGSSADVIEILNETHGLIEDMVVFPGNLTTGHRATIRTGLPVPTWRRLNYPVTPTKSRTAQIDDSCGLLEAWAEVDCELVELHSDPQAYRLSEDAAFIEGMRQEVEETWFYGNEGTEPAAFTGMAPRFNSLSAENGENIISAGGTGSDNRSIWLHVWGPRRVHGIVPKNAKAGINVNDLGKAAAESGPDGTAGRMLVYRTQYTARLGCHVPDWRYVVRIANIDISELNATATGNSANLPQLLFEALSLPPNLMGRPAFYAERDVWTKLRQQIENRVSNSTLTSEMVGGVMTERFHGVPIRQVDALSTDEAQVT